MKPLSERLADQLWDISPGCLGEGRPVTWNTWIEGQAKVIVRWPADKCWWMEDHSTSRIQVTQPLFHWLINRLALQLLTPTANRLFTPSGFRSETIQSNRLLKVFQVLLNLYIRRRDSGRCSAGVSLYVIKGKVQSILLFSGYYTF